MNDESWNEIQKKMARLHLYEEDLTERFILGSGRGGQKLQKTSSCVQLIHHPSGITIRCQRSRLRQANRLRARVLLCSKIEKLQEEEKALKKQELEKLRRQRRKRSRAGQEQTLEDKRRRSSVKKLRGRPKITD